MTIHQRLWGFQPPFLAHNPESLAVGGNMHFLSAKPPASTERQLGSHAATPPKKKGGVKPVTPKMRWCKTQNASFCGSTTILRNLDPGWSLEDVPFMSIDHLHDGKHDPYPIWPRLCAISRSVTSGIVTAPDEGMQCWSTPENWMLY